MSGSRIYTAFGLAAVFAAMGLALVGSFVPALFLLASVIVAGLGFAVFAWRSRR